MLHISLSAEKIASIGPFPVTNSLLSTWFVMGVLIGISLYINKSITRIPSNAQLIAEMVISGLYDFFESVMGHQAKKVFPLLASLFIFIIVANWMGLVPGVGTIGFYEEIKPKTKTIEVQKKGSDVQNEHISEEVPTVPAMHTAEPVETEKKFIPILRGATADLNMTIALAIIAFLAIQYFGFATLGIHYGKRFFNFSNPIMFFVGLLEIVSDLSKVISFAFRLFGNIFAGEVLLAVIAFLMPFLTPIPFLMLELFVGFIQALVFSTLTAVFINVAIAHEG